MNGMVVVGGGGHAKVLASILRKRGAWRLLGYTDLSDCGTLSGLPYLGSDDVLNRVIGEEPACRAAIGVGQLGDSRPRRAIHARLKTLGFQLPAIVSPDALVADGVVLGEGGQVFDRVVVNPGARIGACCILNTGCIVEHDVTVGEFTHIAPGATVCGDAWIGPGVLVGANATVIQGTVIAGACVIGAGAVVAENLTVPGTYAGVPARRIR